MYQLYRLDAENPMQVSTVVPTFCGDERIGLENLLAANTSLLPGDQMAGDNEDPYRWMLIRQQMPVESASSGESQLALDLLFVDQFGWLTFIECKLRSNRESYRKIVGQMLEYVSSAQHYWTAEHLKEYITADRLEALAPQVDTVEEFSNLAIENLRAGKVRLVFLLDEAPKELKAIATFLNRQLNETEVFVVELRHFEDGERRFVMPLVFGYSEEALARRKAAAIEGTPSDFEAALMASADNEQERPALRKLRDFCDRYPIHWGRGKPPAGSVVLPCSEPRSAITVWPNGDVTLNFDYMSNPAANVLRSSLLADKIAFKTEQKFPAVKRTAWTPKADLFIAALEKVASLGLPIDGPDTIGKQS